MDEKRSAGLRLPVQAAVDRTATHATLAQGADVEASIYGVICRWLPTKDGLGVWLCTPGGVALPE
jgi:hypothetical protein